MTAKEALVHFLAHALQKRWRDRYVSLVQSKRGKERFLNDLHHEIEDRFDLSKSTKNLTE